LFFSLLPYHFLTFFAAIAATRFVYFVTCEWWRSRAEHKPIPVALAVVTAIGRRVRDRPQALLLFL
jgi:hypothetical protein